MAIYIGQVLSLDDVGRDGQITDGDRIKVKILPSDQHKTKDKIPWAFPALPKMLHVKPKVGEAVLVVTENDDQDTQRYYIGPLISQPQFMQYDDFVHGGTRLLDNSIVGPSKAPSTNPETEGCYGTDADVALYGRKDCDIILGEDDLRIRCGARKFKMYEKEYEFNKKNPSLIKLKQHDTQLVNESQSTATILADDINLISNNGSPYFDTFDTKEQITDDTMNKIIEKAHVLPYGDTLVDFLTMFLQMFKSHTHKYADMPPCPDDCSKKLDLKYGSGTGTYNSTQYDYTRGISESTRFEDTSKTFKGLGEKLLSKHVRIN